MAGTSSMSLSKYTAHAWMVSGIALARSQPANSFEKVAASDPLKSLY
jgi:hypothetical protein